MTAQANEIKTQALAILETVRTLNETEEAMGPTEIHGQAVFRTICDIRSAIKNDPDRYAKHWNQVVENVKNGVIAFNVDELEDADPIIMKMTLVNAYVATLATLGVQYQEFSELVREADLKGITNVENVVSMALELLLRFVFMGPNSYRDTNMDEFGQIYDMCDDIFNDEEDNMATAFHIFGWVMSDHEERYSVGMFDRRGWFYGVDETSDIALPSYVTLEYIANKLLIYRSEDGCEELLNMGYVFINNKSDEVPTLTYIHRKGKPDMMPSQYHGVMEMLKAIDANMVLLKMHGTKKEKTRYLNVEDLEYMVS